MRKVPRVKIPDFVIATFTTVQMQALLDTCDLTTAMDVRNYTVLLVFMDTGIRVSELCGLRLDDIHDDYIKVIGKFSKPREVGIGATTSRALFKYIHQFRQPTNDKVPQEFLSRTGKPLYTNYVWQMLHDAGELVGIEGCG
jgi:site-specific recombinase XerD